MRKKELAAAIQKASDRQTAQARRAEQGTGSGD
jgi:hypothetical protein